jgi:hypothetical protein
MRSATHSKLKLGTRTSLVLAIGLLWALALPASSFALSGSSATGQPAAAQYTPPHNVAPANSNNTPGSNGTDPVEAGEASGVGGLPFTGYALITVGLVGLGLLSTGVVIRRRTLKPSRPAA